MIKPTKQGQRGITNVGITGATTLIGEKPTFQRNRDIKMKHTTRKE